MQVIKSLLMGETYTKLINQSKNQWANSIKTPASYKTHLLLCFVPFHLALSTMHLLGVRLDWDEKLKLFYYLVYFCYYL